MDFLKYEARKYDLHLRMKELHSKRLEKCKKKQVVGRVDRIHLCKQKELLTRLVDKYTRRIHAMEISTFGDSIMAFHGSITLHS